MRRIRSLNESGYSLRPRPNQAVYHASGSSVGRPDWPTDGFVEVTASVPNASLAVPGGMNASSWTMQYPPDAYPHWFIHFVTIISTALTAAFVDSKGGVVGAFKANQLSTSSIGSGAIMMLTIALHPSSLSGVTVALSYAGHTGMLELAVG